MVELLALGMVASAGLAALVSMCHAKSCLEAAYWLLGASAFQWMVLWSVGFTS